MLKLMQSHVIDVVLSLIDIKIYILLPVLTHMLVVHIQRLVGLILNVSVLSIDFGGRTSFEHACDTQPIFIFGSCKTQIFHRLSIVSKTKL